MQAEAAFILDRKAAHRLAVNPLLVRRTRSPQVGQARQEIVAEEDQAQQQMDAEAEVQEVVAEAVVRHEEARHEEVVVAKALREDGVVAAPSVAVERTIDFSIA